GRGGLNAGAGTFHGVVEDYLHQADRGLGHASAKSWGHAAATSYHRIGATWWEQRIQRGASPRTVAASGVVHLHPTAAGVWTFGRDGATVSLPDRKGLHHLRFLLGRPNVDVPVTALAASAAGHAGEVGGGASGVEILDAQALSSYRQRLQDLDAELAEVESWNDEA